MRVGVEMRGERWRSGGGGGNRWLKDEKEFLKNPNAQNGSSNHTADSTTKIHSDSDMGEPGQSNDANHGVITVTDSQHRRSVIPIKGAGITESITTGADIFYSSLNEDDVLSLKRRRGVHVMHGMEAGGENNDKVAGGEKNNAMNFLMAGHGFQACQK